MGHTRRRATALLVPVIVATAGGFPLALAATPEPVCSDDAVATKGRLEAALVQEVNIFRAANALPEVSPEPALSTAARQHGKDMAHTGRLSHTGNDGSDFTIRNQRAAYRGFARAENLAWGQRSPAAVVAAWADSSGHRRNMLLADITHIGTAVECDASGAAFWVMTVGTSRIGNQTSYSGF